LKKTVDIIIPAYNAEKYIRQAILSVASQTYQINKIIVVDDGSIDKTAEIVKSIIVAVPVTLISQNNKGPNAARNEGLRQSDSEYIAFLDADDFWKKDKVEKQMSVFESSEYENLGLVYCGYELIDENGKKIIKKIIKPVLRGKIFQKLLKANLISGSPSTVLMKKEVLEKVGFLDESLRGSEDWDMWLRIAEKFDFDYVDESLIYVADLTESNSKNFELMLINRILFINKWIHIISKYDRLVVYHRNKLVSGAIRCKIKNQFFRIAETISRYISTDARNILFGGKINITKSVFSVLFSYLFRRKLW